MEDKFLAGPKSQDIEKRWDKFCFAYNRFAAKTYQASAATLFEFVGGAAADCIVEMACGDGTISVEIALNKKPSAKLVCNDISVNMCKVAYERLRRLAAKAKAGQVLGIKQEVLSPVDVAGVELGQGTIADLCAQVLHCSNETLTQHVAPGTADCLIASLSLHLVEQPEAMVAECHRLLRPQGRAVFTVFGSVEKSFQFTLVDQTRRHFGLLPDDSKRSSFHMNDREKVKRMFESAGFGQILIWETLTPFFLRSESERLEELQMLLQIDWPEDMAHLLDQAVAHMWALQQDLFLKQHHPMSLNLQYIYCVKQ